jgi:hypothetical protein
MKDLFNYIFITSVAYSLLGYVPMQFGFPNVLNHIPEDNNTHHRSVERGDICVCVSCTWKMQEMPTKFLVRRLGRKTKAYMGG